MTVPVTESIDDLLRRAVRLSRFWRRAMPGPGAVDQGNVTERLEELEALVAEQARLMMQLFEHVATPIGRREGEPACDDGDRVARYRELIPEFRDLVCRVTPPGARVLIVSRGDGELLALDDRVAGHFPQTSLGAYAGHHPASGADAVAHLEALRLQGGEFLAFPDTARWWLDHYHELAQHLADHSEVVADDAAGLVWALHGPIVVAGVTVEEQVHQSTETPTDQLIATLRGILPPDEEVALLGVEGDGRTVVRRIVPSRGNAVGAGSELHVSTLADASRAIMRLRDGGLRFVVAPASTAVEERLRVLGPSLEPFRVVVDQRHVCRVIELARSAS